MSGVFYVRCLDWMASCGRKELLFSVSVTVAFDEQPHNDQLTRVTNLLLLGVEISSSFVSRERMPCFYITQSEVETGSLGSTKTNSWCRWPSNSFTGGKEFDEILTVKCGVESRRVG